MVKFDLRDDPLIRKDRSPFKLRSRVVLSAEYLRRYPKRHRWKGEIAEFFRAKRKGVRDTFIKIYWNRRRSTSTMTYDDIELQGFEYPKDWVRPRKRYLLHPSLRSPVASIRTCPHGVPQPGKCPEC